MAVTHQEPTEPRIIKKKKAAHGGHGGAWKVAYADFVTAMMALFIVLWIMSQSQSIRLNVAQYFKNPGLLPGATGLMEVSDLGGEMPTPGHSQDLQTPSPISPELAPQKGSLEEVKKRLTEIIAQLPELSRLKNQVALEITDEGLRIELLDMENSHFFEIGSAALKPETKEILRLIAAEVAKLPYRLTVEGHTDSRPYGGKAYTNWELSTDRANAARRFLEEAGVRPGQVTSVRGFADQRLRYPDDPLNLQNRRVSIVLQVQEQERREQLLSPGREKSPLNGKASETQGNGTRTKNSELPHSPPPKRNPPSGVSGPPQDKVSEEVKQLFSNQPGGSPKKVTSPFPSPQERLGW